MKHLGIYLSAFVLCSCGISSMTPVADQDHNSSINTQDAKAQKQSNDNLVAEAIMETSKMEKIESKAAIIIEEIEETGSLDLTGPNQIINGDFSYPEVNGSWQLFSSEEEDMSAFGWETKFNSDQPCSVDDSSNTNGLLEIQKSGKKQWAELDSHCRMGQSLDTSITIQQSLVLTPGSYVLSFRYKDRKNGKDSSEGLSIQFGETIVPVSPSGSWQTYTAKVTIMGETKEVDVVIKDQGQGDTYGALIDDVLVTPYQETENLVNNQ